MKFRISYAALVEFSVLLLIILSGYINSAIYKINNYRTFPNLDEVLWHLRSRIFIDKISEFDFSGLIQSLQPGIMVYWFTGFMMKLVPKESYDFDVIGRIVKMANDNNVSYNFIINLNDDYLYDYSEKISFIFNVPIYLMLTIFFILSYYLMKKIGFNRVVSALFVFFLSTNLFLVYFTTPSDKFLIVFIILSFLTFLVYMDQKTKRNYLALSAIFGAMAVLSKLTAFFIIPFYFLAYLYYQMPYGKDKLKAALKDACIWSSFFIATCIIFLPLLITSPNEVYNYIFQSTKTIDNHFGQARGRETAAMYLDLFKASINMGLIMLQVLSLLFSVIILSLFRKSREFKEAVSDLPKKHIITSAIFVITFLIFVIVLSKNRDIRQLSPAIAIANIAIAAGIYGASGVLMKKMNIQNPYRYSFVIITLAFLQLCSVLYNGTLFQLMIKYYTGQMN